MEAGKAAARGHGGDGVIAPVVEPARQRLLPRSDEDTAVVEAAPAPLAPAHTTVANNGARGPGGIAPFELLATGTPDQKGRSVREQHGGAGGAYLRQLPGGRQVRGPRGPGVLLVRVRVACAGLGHPAGEQHRPVEQREPEHEVGLVCGGPVGLGEAAARRVDGEGALRAGRAVGPAEDRHRAIRQRDARGPVRRRVEIGGPCAHRGVVGDEEAGLGPAAGIGDQDAPTIELGDPRRRDAEAERGVGLGLRRAPERHQRGGGAADGEHSAVREPGCLGGRQLGSGERRPLGAVVVEPLGGRGGGSHAGEPADHQGLLAPEEHGGLALEARGPVVPVVDEAGRLGVEVLQFGGETPLGSQTPDHEHRAVGKPDGTVVVAADRQARNRGGEAPRRRIVRSARWPGPCRYWCGPR